MDSNRLMEEKLTAAAPPPHPSLSHGEAFLDQSPLDAPWGVFLKSYSAAELLHQFIGKLGGGMENQLGMGAVWTGLAGEKNIWSLKVTGIGIILS